MSDRILEADVGILGAGPGGLAAARELAAAGLRVTLLDENARPGGQIWRQLPAGFAADPRPQPPSHQLGHVLLDAVAAAGDRVRTVQGATVWDLKPGRMWFEQGGASWLLRCRHLILAPGAYDLALPFPGWTLPGVVTAGGAQVMVRGFGVKPGRRALVVGSGPLLLPTMTALAGAGVEVVAALEAAPRSAMWRALPGVLLSAARFREALFYLRALRARSARLRWGWTVFAAEGDADGVRAVVIGRVDAQGRPRRDTAQRLEVDLVAAGFGLVPSIESALLLGCKVQHLPHRGGHCVVTDEAMRTTVPGVFAVGEVVGVGGAEVAVAEGELAAAAILAELGKGEVPTMRQRRVRGQRRAADALLAAFPPLPGLRELANDDTIACRCEDVTVGALRAAGAVHGDDVRGLKMGTRAGMGPCQARICGPSLQALAGAGRRPAEPPSVQVPLKPVPTGIVLDAPPA